MTILAILVVIFAAVHALPALPSVKGGLKAQLGRAYGPLYGVLSLILLVAILWAYRKAPSDLVYDVPSWGRHANFGLTLLGFICLGIFLFRGSWRASLRYPMAIGVLLWATGHLLANGDTCSIVFFGGLALAALLQVFLMMQGGVAAPADVRNGHNFLSVMAGIALDGLMTQLHYAVTGMPLVVLQ